MLKGGAARGGGYGRHRRYRSRAAGERGIAAYSHLGKCGGCEASFPLFPKSASSPRLPSSLPLATSLFPSLSISLYYAFLFRLF